MSKLIVINNDFKPEIDIYDIDEDQAQDPEEFTNSKGEFVINNNCHWLILEKPPQINIHYGKRTTKIKI